MSDNIKVVVKVRPLISREIEDKLNYRWRIRNNTLHQLDQNGREMDVAFTFDKVYDTETKTEEVYNDVAKPIVEAAIAGFNGTIFAYGQTSSGKTYTMTGTDSSPGIIPMAVLNLFKIIKSVPDRDFLVRVSYIEIYNEKLRDLLDVEKTNIKVHDTLQGVKVDCTEKVTSSPEEVLEAMKEGEANRQTGATNMNEESSRSHSIFQITIESREHIEGGDSEGGCVNVSQLNLVDLAGSERAGQTGATGIRFKEGTHINKSLSVLALVIKQLSEDPNKYANYRDSKLTRILQNSLGGNAKTSIVCAITPASVEETISTLQFANRAKAIKNKPEVNAVATNATMIQKLTKQLSKLQSELANKRNLEVMLESRKTVEQELQNKIAQLQKFIINGMKSSLDIGGWRKPVAPRRMTISTATLHHIEEEPILAIPKFCTPSLKYNPMALAAVPEETRMITPPPPKDKKVDFENEIIEIDSDEESTETRCSPYHKCYGASKTPPCILRKNAQRAEKTLKDIVELTEREKIYTPSVVELIEKLEQNANTISKLQEEITALVDTSKEKDLKIEELTHKVKKMEEQVDAISSDKVQLELKCREKDTQLTDWEVSYETLMKKSKSREQDLLSLLAEQKPKVNQNMLDIGKAVSQTEQESINFMDMSKDISLVNSDHETSVASISHPPEGTMQELVIHLQSQLTCKNQAILKHEEDIFKHQQKMEALEISCQQLQSAIDDYKLKFSTTETENSFLKHTIQNLNKTIENQKKSLDSADKDMKHYNIMIQELQNKLRKYNDIFDMKLDDSVIENMIANEEKFLANNENIKNIIHSLKITIDVKKKEFDTRESDLLSDNSLLKKQIELKEQQITTLIEEAAKLNSQIDENMTMMTKLLKVEEDLTSELNSLREKNETLENQNTNIALQIEGLCKINDDNKDEIEKLSIKNKELTQVIVERDIHKQYMISQSNKLSEKIEIMAKKVENLEKDLEIKKTSNDELLQVISEKEANENMLTNTIQNLVNDLQSKQAANDELCQTIAAKEDYEHSLYTENLQLAKQLHDMSKTIQEFEKDVNDKNIKEIDLINERYLTQAQAVISELETISVKLSNGKDSSSESIKDLGKAFEIIISKLSVLDQSVNKVFTECRGYQEELLTLENKHKETVEDLHSQMEKMKCAMDLQSHNLSEELSKLKKELCESQTETEKLTQTVLTLESKLEKENLKNLNKIQYILLKVHAVVNKQIGYTEIAEEELNNIDTMLSILDNKVDSLDNYINRMLQSSSEIQQQHTTLAKEHETQLENFRLQIEKLNKDMSLQAHELKQYLNQTTQDLGAAHSDLETKNQQIIKLEALVNDLKHKNEGLQKNIISKESAISFFQSNISSLRSDIELLRNDIMDQNAYFQSNNYTLEELLKDKCYQIINLENFLQQIVSRVCKITCECGLEKMEPSDIIDSNYGRVIVALDQISLYLSLLKTENDVERCDIEGILKTAQDEIQILTQKNIKMLDEYEKNNSEKEALLLELQDVNALLEDLRADVEIKNNELNSMEAKAKEWKEQFLKYEDAVKHEIKDLVAANKRLKNIVMSQTHDESKIDLQSNEWKENISYNEPKSLLSICCNKIMDYLQEYPNELESSSATSSKPSISFQNTELQADRVKCVCKKLSLELNAANDEIIYLKRELSKISQDYENLEDILKDLHASNKFLLDEREEVRKEIQQLAEPAYELHKKIANHKTNLSTLTATMYAENKLLNSQLKVLKHHHTRYINVCQRDLPAFKKQLNELMSLLRECSLNEKQNSSFKRYSLPDVLDNSTSTLKHESTFDGELLMLDTNVTLTTVNNTLAGPDQTFFDVTQVNFENEACQTLDESKINNPYLVHTQMEILSHDNKIIIKKLEDLNNENSKLKGEIHRLLKCDETCKETQTESGNFNGENEIVSSAEIVCKYCQDLFKEVRAIKGKLTEDLELKTAELQKIQEEKDILEQKYKNQTFDKPSIEALKHKLDLTEKECQSRVQENEKLKCDLNKKNGLVKELQEENTALSNQIIDNISELDDLKNEVDGLKDTNRRVSEKCNTLESTVKGYESLINENSLCTQCNTKCNLIKNTQHQAVVTSKLSRSFSDSENSSRHTIFTLQHELHASKEDCKQLTEEVTTIKYQLERSNVSVCPAMDSGENLETAESSEFSFKKRNLENTDNLTLPHTFEALNVCLRDRSDCIDFCLDKLGTGKENVDDKHIKIIDILKTLYSNLMATHGNEVENLRNQLRILQDGKDQLQVQYNNSVIKYEEVVTELENINKNFCNVQHILSLLRDNTEIMRNVSEFENNTKLATHLKEKVLKIMDSEFGFSLVSIFDAIGDKIFKEHESDLNKLQSHLEFVLSELNSVNDSLEHMKGQLSEKEKEYNLLKAQKDKMHEISSAVTLDIVNKEKELAEALKMCCGKLAQFGVSFSTDTNLSLSENVIILVESILKHIEKQSKTEDKHTLSTNFENMIGSLQRKLFETETKLSQKIAEKQNMDLELVKIKNALDEKEKVWSDQLSMINYNLSYQTQLREDLTKKYDLVLEENKSNANVIQELQAEIESLKEKLDENQTLKKEIEILKKHISQKDALINSKENLKQDFESSECADLLGKLECWQKDYNNLKSVNEMIIKEKEIYALELEDARQTIAKNNEELQKLTADILVLRQSVNENISIIDKLKQEANSLVEHNTLLKQQLEEKSVDHARLERNIKTHEKTVEIQSKMIIRLQKQKEEDDKALTEKDKLIDLLTKKSDELQKECEELNHSLENAKKEMEGLKSKRDSLEAKIVELETDFQDGPKRRQSIDFIAESARKRRQSLHDSKRAFEGQDIEEVFQARDKPDDLFMDVDGEECHRGSHGRDSLEEDIPSRPSSVTQSRRRRQTIHDQHRTSLRRSPSPPTGASDGDHASEAGLRRQLAACLQELEDLKEKYRELDEECDICAQYLRERDEQCRNLRKEKTALEMQVSDLNQKLMLSDTSQRPDVSHVAVNTDEDWANLHSVVVDRMSFDAEVEKNKKLSRTIEELRCNKQELKNTIAKMQRALERNQSKELEATKEELAQCRQQLEELQERYRELDEECETCAQYLRERDEQCRKLREAKKSLEAKLEELGEEAAACGAAATARRRRQSAHDHNREPASAPLAHAQTEISDDLLSYQVERDENTPMNKAHAQELERVKMTLDRVLREKATLENQLMAAMTSSAHSNPTMYVATGSAIVQNQQITDVMKENQKLKKINAKLINICKKRGKSNASNQENEEPSKLE